MLGSSSVARYCVRGGAQNAGLPRCVLLLPLTLPLTLTLTLTLALALTLTQAPDGGHAVWMCSTDKPKEA